MGNFHFFGNWAQMPEKDCKQGLLKFQFWKREHTGRFAGTDQSKAGGAGRSWESARLDRASLAATPSDNRAVPCVFVPGSASELGIPAGKRQPWCHDSGSPRPRRRPDTLSSPHTHRFYRAPAACQAPGTKNRTMGKIQPTPALPSAPAQPLGNRQGLCSSQSHHRGGSTRVPDPPSFQVAGWWWIQVSPKPPAFPSSLHRIVEYAGRVFCLLCLSFLSPTIT